MALRYRELLWVLAAAALGLGVASPLRWLVDHQGINVLLAVLVFATALTIAPAEFTDVARAWRRLTATVVAGAVVLPALAWAASRLVAAGALRDGVAAVGLAPCEIASVATTAMAGGAAGFAAGVLVGSTVATVALAGPILALEAGGSGIHPGHVVVNLVLVVLVPLAVGLVVRRRVPQAERAGPVANLTAIGAVAALVALIASEVHLGTRYLAVAGALAVVVIASGLLGRMVGIGAAPSVGRAVVLTTSMRDFAIAASLATSAFGPAAAAPLGLYGILVLAWGTGAAGAWRSGVPPSS